MEGRLMPFIISLSAISAACSLAAPFPRWPSSSSGRTSCPSRRCPTKPRVDLTRAACSASILRGWRRKGWPASSRMRHDSLRIAKHVLRSCWRPIPSHHGGSLSVVSLSTRPGWSSVCVSTSALLVRGAFRLVLAGVWHNITDWRYRQG